VPKPFPAEFRRDVISVARSSDASMASIARDFGVSESCLARWLKLADRDDGLGDRPGGRRADGSTSGSPVTPAGAATAEQRLRDLEKRNRQLEQENEVLRRATAYFARDVLPK
jgi:transposase